MLAGNGQTKLVRVAEQAAHCVLVNVSVFGYRFAPPLWAVLLYLVVCVAMLALARWQLLRADEKIMILSAAEEAALLPPVDVSSMPGPDRLREAGDTYVRAFASGHWRAEQQFLWDNRAHASQAGVEVISPLELADGRVLLVNRGWTRLGVTRDILPDVFIAGATHAASDLDKLARRTAGTVSGTLSRPSRGFAKGQAFDPAAPWPRYLQYFDYAALSVELEAEVLPVVLQADHQTSGPWLQSNWRPAASGPEKHYAYAVQWFGMAGALTIIFLVVNGRRIETNLNS